MNLSRRTFVAAAVALPALSPLRAFPQTAAAAALADSGPLGDVVLGDPAAKVTVIEYASLTCSHCAAFHAKTWPAFKAKYVDTGKVKFILREFPLDPLATAAAMLARCSGKDRHYAMVDLFFDKQSEWAFVRTPVEAMAALVGQTGMSRDRFEACLTDDAVYAGVNASKDNALSKLGVNSTPTFFVNGAVLRGDLPIEKFDEAIAPLL